MTSETQKFKVAVIGGSGLNKPTIFSDCVEKDVVTPYGKPSDVLFCGQIKGLDCVILSRHGRHHSISPTNVNYRANIWALKEEGCTHVVATTACGSLQGYICPGDLVFLDQFIDRTTKRESTFYDGATNSPPGICHLPMHEPFCPATREILINSAKALNMKYHPTGTNVTIEGSRFSTRAESRLYQSWGAHVINMTTVPEVILAKEAGLCYASVALVTDYDCWRESDQDVVSKDAVLETLKSNVDKVTRLLLDAIPRIANTDFSDVIKQTKLVANSSVMLPS